MTCARLSTCDDGEEEIGRVDEPVELEVGIFRDDELLNCRRVKRGDFRVAVTRLIARLIGISYFLSTHQNTLQYNSLDTVVNFENHHCHHRQTVFVCSAPYYHTLFSRDLTSKLSSWKQNSTALVILLPSYKDTRKCSCGRAWPSKK